MVPQLAVHVLYILVWMYSKAYAGSDSMALQPRWEISEYSRILLYLSEVWAQPLSDADKSQGIGTQHQWFKPPSTDKLGVRPRSSKRNPTSCPTNAIRRYSVWREFTGTSHMFHRKNLRFPSKSEEVHQHPWMQQPGLKTNQSRDHLWNSKFKLT